ncbi:ATP-binding protein [Lederbergia wuyishanensis]|uniref:histidine kinase n=1 Tax=Lederbergia wuyishanensis TaxID=1347903 RepID=A0ABU0D7N0_9BACI|nr:sensor histidine kinase [Lederbergia wuyishanensis]MCJ8009073.1 ATP-binding protein [Lederbergia wuyishanensis]MDQ0344409.1 signal transduction histidine kinase [Lederbergia wuyishanensis]
MHVLISKNVLSNDQGVIITVIGLLICTIGLIPIVLAINIKKIYRESKLSRGLFFYMIFITVWQIDIGVLYFNEVWSEKTVLFLFKLFRIGPTFAVVMIFYIAYLILEGEPTTQGNHKWLNRNIKKLFNKKILNLLITLSSIIYLINWTDLGISGLELRTGSYSSISFYFPAYGPFHLIYILYEASFIFILISVYLLSKTIVNTFMMNFVNIFSIYSLLLFFTGFLNFSPETGAVSSSIAVIIFCTLIMFEFVKLNNNMKLDYYQLMQRQMKLDYTGSLAASLIHEVKNTNQIIKGFSKMLDKSDYMTERDRGSVDMILRSSEHLGKLADNYKEYMKTSKIELKIDDVESVINNAIDFSQEILNENQVKIEFTNHYKPLKAFINKTYLEQVFINLIKNSVEAIPANRESRKISIKTEIVDNNIVIHFSDTGKGIHIENWKSVFDPFMSFKDKGMGLGLPFVKKMIIEHLGNVYIVESSPEGTRFLIEIPQNGILNMQ